MSSDEHEVLGADEMPHQEFQKLKVLMTPAVAGIEGKSLRFVAEPCERHAKNPPGEQTWVEDSPVDPITGLQKKKRDPNGFVHGCAACEANATVIEEG